MAYLNECSSFFFFFFNKLTAKMYTALGFPTTEQSPSEVYIAFNSFGSNPKEQSLQRMR